MEGENWILTGSQQGRLQATGMKYTFKKSDVEVKSKRRHRI